MENGDDGEGHRFSYLPHLLHFAPFNHSPYFSYFPIAIAIAFAILITLFDDNFQIFGKFSDFLKSCDLKLDT